MLYTAEMTILDDHFSGLPMNKEMRVRQKGNPLIFTKRKTMQMRKYIMSQSISNLKAKRINLTSRSIRVSF